MLETPSICVNCNETHIANNKGCNYFKIIKNKKLNNNQNHSPMKNQLIINLSRKDQANKFSTRTPNLISYADIIKEKTNNTYYSILKQILNGNLQKTITEFFKNILQNIKTIICSIFNTITNKLSLRNKHYRKLFK